MQFSKLFNSRSLELAPDVCDALMERSLDEVLSLTEVHALLGSLNVGLLKGRQEWQKTVAALCLVLEIAAHEAERSTPIN